MTGIDIFTKLKPSHFIIKCVEKSTIFFFSSVFKTNKSIPQFILTNCPTELLHRQLTMNQYVTDTLSAISKLEDTVYKILTLNMKEYSQSRLDVCLWYVRVADYFEMHREIVSISISYLDRYIQITKREITEQNLLLSSLAAFHLAVKLHESKKLPLDALVKLSKGNVTSDEIEEEQGIILRALCWRLHPPTSETFLFLFMEFIPATIPSIMKFRIYTSAQYYNELSTCDSSLAQISPSMIALSSIFIVLERMNYSEVSLRDRAKFISSIYKKAMMKIDIKGIAVVKELIKNAKKNPKITVEKRSGTLNVFERRNWNTAGTTHAKISPNGVMSFA